MSSMKFRLFSLLLFLPVTSVTVFSQGKAKISPYVQLQYFKNSEDQRYLRTTLTYSSNRMEVPLSGLEISFYSPTPEKELLGTAVTDEKGIAEFDLTKIIGNIPLNSDGYWTFSTQYAGNDTIEGGNSDLLIRDVKLEMTLSEVDTVKTITFSASTSKNGKDVPVSGEVIMVYVPRMFSLLPVGEAYLDEKGNASLEFPPDLPGDTEGNITIIARIEEHAEFGNLERISVRRWGMPVINTTPVAHRALWTKTPPWWMIITLSVLLTGVWGHYLFAIISLILIKRDSKKADKLKPEKEKTKFAR